MQLVSSIKVVFLHGKKILLGNPSNLKKGDTILLAKPWKGGPPEIDKYEITSIVSRIDRGVYIEVRVKPTK